MISVMEGDKQVAGIPVKIVKSTMSKIQSKQDDVDIVILEDLSEWRFCLARAIIPVLSEPVFRQTLIHFDFA